MSASLERRYRRLLAWYPREHRAAYQEEMLGVLLDGAGPDRRRPTAAETASLLADALRSRWRRFGRQLAGARWSDAAAIVSLIAPAILLAVHLRDLLDTAGIGPQVQYLDDRPHLGPSTWVPSLAWALVTLAALGGPRIVAAALGWAAFAAEAGVQGLEYQRFGSGARPPQWILLIALVAALALSVRTRPRGALRLLGRWRIGALVALGGYVAVGQIVTVNDSRGPRWLLMVSHGFDPYGIVALACVVLFTRIDAETRRRLLAIIVPLAVFGVLDTVAAYLYYHNNQRWSGWYDLVQAGLLVLLTLATFRVSVALVARQDRRRGSGESDPAAV